MREELLTVEGAIFDCDGTLLDSLKAWDELRDELCRLSNHELLPGEAERFATLTTPETAVLFHESYGLAESNEAVIKIMDDFLMDFYGNRVEAKPGANKILEFFAERGVPMCIASSTPHAQLVAGLEHAGFAHCFRDIVSTDDVNASKREPKIYEHCRGILGTPKETTWGFEDAIYAIRTLNGAGFHTLGIYDMDDSGTMDELRAEATIAIERWGDLF